MRILRNFFITGLCITQFGAVFAADEVGNGKNYKIEFDKTEYVVKTAKTENSEFKYRAFEKIVYVKNPVDIKYEIMNFYVPESYYNGEKINGFDINNAPIFMPNMVGGYMPAEPGTTDITPLPGLPSMNNDKEGNKPKLEGISQPLNIRPNTIIEALSKGFIVAAPGARGRTNQDTGGKFTGKAPAGIVDLKAAVKYLHYNDSIMPGDANKIIVNGTSAGGAMAVLLGASGNSKDYSAYLKEIGAADASDAVYGVSSYCPITDLEHADMAYEWLMNGVNNYRSLQIKMSTDFKMERNFIEGLMTDSQIKLSDELAALYPDYINSLNLKDADGKLLSLDSDGNGSFKEYIKLLLISSAQRALDNKADLSKTKALTIKDGKVTDINLKEYYRQVGRMKVTPAFDGLDLSNGENDLFGTESKAAQHFTDFGYKNSLSGGSLADKKIIKMMNPMSYVVEDGIDSAKFWRIRHGAVDMDTSVSVSAALTLYLRNKGNNVDYFVPWNISHSGDYDLDELFSWIKNISK